MALQLRVVSEHRRLLGERSCVVFDSAGGKIGRSADNDWVLPDPQRYVSAHHARIHFHAGRYLLEDTSTNGVYINDAPHPVAKGAHVLQNGDLIRLGEYELVAMLESGPADVDPAAVAPSATSSVIVDPAASSVEVVAIRQVTQADLGTPLDLGDLLQPARPRASAPPTAKELSAALADSETDRHAIARRIERLALAAARAEQRRTSAAPPVPLDANSGLAAFCKGAGIAVDHFGPELQSSLLHLAGQLCREALVGLKDLERVRSENLSPMQIGAPVAAEGSRPSLARAAVADLLVEILAQHESRRLDAVQWLREVIDRAKAHDRATFAALRAAFVDFIARLEPAELESRFKRRDGAGSGARNWELYTEFFRSIAAKADDPLPRVFLNAFGAAYDKHQPPSDPEPRPVRDK